jgi:thiamine kinase-like enzyme
MKGLLEIGSRFALEDQPFTCGEYGSGHIHGTYLLEAGDPGESRKYILQKLNTRVFRKPESVQDNIRRILDYLARSEEDNEEFLDLQIIGTKEGKLLHRTEEGDYWRCFRFIENTRTLQRAENPEQAFEGGRSFAIFTRRLKNYNPRRLHVTIPHFRDMEWRQHQLTYAELTHPGERLKRSQPELKRVRELTWIGEKYTKIRKALPDRVVHNDTKINNILFDAVTGKGKCIIDLDTVMTGTLLTDFGDMVRSFTTSGSEDKTDPGSMTCREDVFRGLVEGYADGVSGFISEVEMKNLFLGAQAIVYMQAIRFLADYLSGDLYYKTTRPEHNLDRARNQLGLLDSINEKESLLRTILGRFF